MNRLISIRDREEWLHDLALSGDFDVYHTPHYHELEAGTADRPYLFSLSEGNARCCVPFIVRDIGQLDWYTGNATDGVSVYGYPGPLFNEPARQQPGFIRMFESTLISSLKRENVVTLFLRHHPILSPYGIFSAGETAVGETIVVDVSISPEERLQRYRKSNRYEIRKARKTGVKVRIDEGFEDLDAFVELYEERMKSVSARDDYFFSTEYYKKLCGLPDNATKLFHAEFEGKIISSSFFLLSESGIQYHLSANRAGYEHLSGTRLLIDAAADYAHESGRRWLNLGGGVGGREDSLLRFKSGFSKETRQFRVSRLIIDQDRYDQLCRMSPGANAGNRSDFFPKYRA